MSSTLPLSEADLHGLVDGSLDAGRRVDVLRRLAASPADRDRVDAWQDQNELIRHVFLGVDKEPLPATLKLIPPPNLHCVPSDETKQAPAMRRRQRPMAGFATMVLIATGLGGAFMLVQSSDDGSQIVRLYGTADETLASQAARAVDLESGSSTKARSAPQNLADTLPTATIPDLTSAGFAFTSAEIPASAPSSLVFHYRNAAADRIAVSVTRAPASMAATGPTQIGRSFSWHHGETAFAIAGTLRPDRLRAMANLLQVGGDE